MEQVLGSVPQSGLDAVLVAVDLVLKGSTPNGCGSVEHVRNVLARLNAPPKPEDAQTAMQLPHLPIADTARYDRLRLTHNDDQGVSMLDSTRNVQSELKALRLNGMANAWADLTEQDDGSAIQSARWLVERLLLAEDVDRHMSSIAHQMRAACFPIHRDLAGFDFDVSQVDKALIKKLADLRFTEDAQNVVLIGGLGTGKTQLVSAS